MLSMMVILWLSSNGHGIATDTDAVLFQVPVGGALGYCTRSGEGRTVIGTNKLIGACIEIDGGSFMCTIHLYGSKRSGSVVG